MPNTIVRQNERSWAITLIIEINLFLQSNNLKIKKAGGESTISSDNKSMFPDVLLYGDQKQTQILQGWELKLPDTPITDETFIKDAQRKADSLGLNSCFIWNFSSGVLYVKSEQGIFNIEKQWNVTSHIRSREDVKNYQNEWLPVISNILLEINEFFVTGTIHGSELGEILPNTIAVKIIERNKLVVSESLRQKAVEDSTIEAYLDNWWKDIKVEFVSDEVDKFSAYSKVLLLNWINKIIFAHLLKRNHNKAFEVQSLNFDSSPEEANNFFNQLTAECDFFSIFNNIEYNTNLPHETWHDLMDLNVFLTNNGLHSIEQTSLQSILERTVAASKREVNGQFTTPITLAELLTKISVRNRNGYTIDPCCGTGTIANEVLKLKIEKTQDLLRSIETTWASDKYSFPLQIANICLARADSINIPIKIFQQNVFNLNTGNEIHFIDPSTGNQINIPLPEFDTIVSNLPFIEFEKIASSEIHYMDLIRQKIYVDTNTNLDRRSDYYIFIVFYLWNILRIGGRLGIITSNSWLGTDSGNTFFKALEYYFNIEQLHLSNSGRWFKNADVVTLISILSKKEQISIPKENSRTVFCSWEKSIAELEGNSDFRNEIVNSSILNKETDANVIKLKPYLNSQIKQLQEMKVSLTALFHDVSWLIDIKENLIPIHEVFDVIRGERRGWDALFYPAPGHNIENIFLKKVLKNSRSINTLVAVADGDAFCCSDSLDKLTADNHLGALAWINRFKDVENGAQRPLHEVLKRANMHWYEMKDTNIADIVTTMNPYRRLFFAKFDTPSFINQRLIGLKSKRTYPDLDLNHALLNSLVGMFYIEAVGFGRGLGALDINKKTIRNAFMLNPNLVTEENRSKILEKFSLLLERNILQTEQELASPDRINFDHEVLKSFGIGNLYSRIKDCLLSMQRMRLSVR